MSGESRNPEERRASSPAARAITPARPLRIERISDRADLPRADLTPRHSVHPSLHDTLLLNYATNANLSLPSTHFRVFLLAKANHPPRPSLRLLSHASSRCHSSHANSIGAA
jgi:hypothetical protein